MIKIMHDESVDDRVICFDMRNQGESLGGGGIWPGPWGTK